jgi:hypothetical protein
MLPPRTQSRSRRHALGAIRAPTAPERERMAHDARTRELWRLETAQYLAGVVELQLLLVTLALSPATAALSHKPAERPFA